MNRYEIIFEGRLVSTTGDAPSRRVVEESADLLAAELEKTDAEDIDVSTNLSECTVTASVTAEANELAEAQIAGSTTLRAAFHAAEVGTPGWSIDWTSARTIPEADCHPELATA